MMEFKDFLMGFYVVVKFLELIFDALEEFQRFLCVFNLVFREKIYLIICYLRVNVLYVLLSGSFEVVFFGYLEVWKI